jgi:hypothetical protein
MIVEELMSSTCNVPALAIVLRHLIVRIQNTIHLITLYYDLRLREFLKIGCLSNSDMLVQLRATW